MTDLDKLFDRIRQLPPDRRKMVVNYAEHVVSGRLRKDRQTESEAAIDARITAFNKAIRARRLANS